MAGSPCLSLSIFAISLTEKREDAHGMGVRPRDGVRKVGVRGGEWHRGAMTWHACQRKKREEKDDGAVLASGSPVMAHGRIGRPRL